MKKTVLTYGLISGVIMAALMSVTLPFTDKLGYDRGPIVIYAAMVVAFLLVFFGIKSYRDNVGRGEISFGRAFSVGILITLITCVIYVIAWEIIYFNFLQDFAVKYSAYITEKSRAAGATTAQINEQVQHVHDMKALLDKPWISAPIIFLTEPLPVGLVISLISAAILRKRRRQTEVPV